MVKRSPTLRPASLLPVALPVLVGSAYMLERLAGANAVVADLWRPLGVIVAVAIVAFTILAALLRRSVLAAMLATVLITVLFVYVIPAILFIGVVAWWFVTAAMRRVRHEPPFDLGNIPFRAAMAYATGLFVIALVSVIGAYWPRLPPVRAAEATASEASEALGPDIYIVIADAYPRWDTLSETFGFDNSAFEDSLESLGFSVSRQAQSNYNKTWLTVESMLDGRYISDNPMFDDPPEGEAAQMVFLHEAIQRAALLDAFREYGYDIVSIQSNIRTTDLSDGVEAHTTGHLTGIELSMASGSLLGRLFPEPMVDVLTGDMRADVTDQLKMLRDIARSNGPGGRPRLVITHLMVPHAPFMLGQSSNYLKGCFPGCGLWSTTEEETGLSRPDFASRLGDQISGLNELLVATAQDLADSSPNAIAIFMSDHGIRHDLSDLDEHFRILFAARTPGYERLFPDDVAPVNVLRRILTRVLGDDLPDLDYSAWVSDWFRPLALQPYQ